MSKRYSAVFGSRLI